MLRIMEDALCTTKYNLFYYTPSQPSLLQYKNITVPAITETVMRKK